MRVSGALLVKRIIYWLVYRSKVTDATSFDTCKQIPSSLGISSEWSPLKTFVLVCQFIYLSEKGKIFHVPCYPIPVSFLLNSCGTSDLLIGFPMMPTDANSYLVILNLSRPLWQCEGVVRRISDLCPLHFLLSLTDLWFVFDVEWDQSFNLRPL